jgi:hypothetical protein
MAAHTFLDELNAMPPLDLSGIIFKAEVELAKITTPERREQLGREIRGPNGYPTHEWERGCGYHPE